MKKIASLFLAAVMAFSLAACGGSDSSGAASQGGSAAGSAAVSAAGGDKVLKVAYTGNNLSNDTVVEALTPIKAYCKEQGWEFTEVEYTSGDVSKLVDNLENLLVAETDIILFQSASGDAVSDVVQRLKDSGCVVVSYDDADHVGSYYLTQSDEEIGTAIGEAAAAYVNEHLDGSADAVALGLPSNDVLTIRANAFIKAYEENCGGKVVFSYDLSQYAGDYASIADSIAQAYPDTKVILSIADTTLVQLSEGLTANGYKPGDIFCFGCDTIKEVREAWLAGEETFNTGSVYTHLPECLYDGFLKAVETKQTGEFSEAEIHQEVIATSAENVEEMFGNK
ncbi:substrate-binding domain-containing protein [Anaerofilum sp. BX8]|uniref:Substrate-binding domain-containing protein n=1 Tax=Anaerofilum hominis TaxID=2763016 RepID=A0A923L0L2_9FIRM|nr:substrate-binding domain-containing protein [Anaerofilum hominis]MBC5580685.1 substrate-binding domain-containing protein [Anaerofilum hominis]